jgi:hypothetical protein
MRSNPASSSLVAAGAGVLLVVAVFLPWYRTNLGPVTVSRSASGWEWTSFARGALALGVVWTLCAAVVLADRLDLYRIDPRTAEGLGWLVVICALGAGGLTAFRLFRPPPEQAEFLTRDVGLFVCLGATIVGAGAGVAMATYRESVRRRYSGPARR